MPGRCDHEFIHSGRISVPVRHGSRVLKLPKVCTDIYVYIYASLCTYVYIYIYIYTCVYIYIYIYMWTFANTCHFVFALFVFVHLYIFEASMFIVISVVCSCLYLYIFIFSFVFAWAYVNSRGSQPARGSPRRARAAGGCASRPTCVYSYLCI